MAMVDADAVPGGHELDDLTRMECAVDGIESAGMRGTVLDDGIGHLAQRVPDRVDTGEIALRRVWIGLGLGAQQVGALAVDDPAFREPVQGRLQGRDPLDRETILEVVGVQEVEGVIEADVMGVVPGGSGSKGLCSHVANHFKPLDRLRARAYSPRSNR